MKFFVDLHMHTSLSPCASDEMTPNNIVNMSILKNLDIIAITDHNSMKNYEAVRKCAENKDLVVVPGMEVETREEVHTICLFPSFEKGMVISELVYSKLPQINNREDIFGEQLIINEFDEIVGKEKKLMLNASDISIDELVIEVRKVGGVTFPAHIDRQSNSILSNLGMIPEDLNFKYLELSKNKNIIDYIMENKNLQKYKFIKSSDAHNLGDIFEREFYLEIERKSIDDLISCIR